LQHLHHQLFVTVDFLGVVLIRDLLKFETLLFLIVCTCFCICRAESLDDREYALVDHVECAQLFGDVAEVVFLADGVHAPAEVGLKHFDLVDQILPVFGVDQHVV